MGAGDTFELRGRPLSTLPNRAGKPAWWPPLTAEGMVITELDEGNPQPTPASREGVHRLSGSGRGVTPA